jgi:hypothetical protein
MVPSSKLSLSTKRFLVADHAFWRPAMLFLGLFSAYVASAIAVLVAEPNLRAPLAPLLTIVCIGLTYLVVIVHRDRQMPVFEVASMWLAAASLYGAYPLLNFIAGGLQWHPWSISRLWLHKPGPAEVGSIGWRYVVWIGTFVVIYLLLRRGAPASRSLPLSIPPRMTFAVLITFAGIVVFLATVSAGYGIEFTPSYRDVVEGQAKLSTSLPLGIARFTHNFLGMRLLMMQIIVLLLLANWKKMTARIALFGFLSIILVRTVLRAGERTELFLLILATGILYHRLVRPLRLRTAVVMAIAFVAAFNFAGMVRQAFVMGMPLAAVDTPLFTEPNEFQAIFGTTADLKRMRDSGELRDVPLQIHFTEFILVVPSPLLPFPKLNPSYWYLDLIGLGGTPYGYMFGAVSQAILGWDWIELALRGMLLALFCTFMHRWYLRNPTSFWRTTFSMFLSIWMYYSVRQASFSFLYFIIYRFIPAMIIVEVVRYLLPSKRLRSGSPATVETLSPLSKTQEAGPKTRLTRTA